MSEPTYDEIMQDKDLAFSEAVKAGVIPPQLDSRGKTAFDMLWAIFSVAHNAPKQSPDTTDDRPV